VTLTDDDYESTDSWLMKKHDGKQILEIFNGDALVEDDIDRINNHNDRNAGNPNGNFKLKTGEEAPSSVREIVNIIKFSQYSQKVTESKSIFAIVSAMEKLFIVPVSTTDRLDILKEKVVAMNAGVPIPDNCKLKNLATGQIIYQTDFRTTECSSLASGQKRTNRFALPANMKWVSFE